LVDAFILRSGFCDSGDSCKTDVPVGRSLVRAALRKAEEGVLSSPANDPLDRSRPGMPRKPSWWTGRIDLVVQKRDCTWLFEAKRDSAIGKVGKALGQVTLYADLYQLDNPECGPIRKAVLFGDIPPGMTESEGGSHGAEVLTEIADMLHKYGVATFARDRGGDFRRLGAGTP
jgi:hypothetical protein